MIIKTKNFRLKLEEILKDELPTGRYNECENFVLGLIRKWHKGSKYFTHQTSGSTGKPKTIEISREQIEISAKATMAAVDPDNKIKSSLLCLNPSFIGGAMVVYRGLIFDHDITITTPTSFPSDAFEISEEFDLVSLAPLQFNKLHKEQIERFGTILIGGATMPVMHDKFDSNVYSTFGMTETVSHIALRPINQDTFTTTGDTVVGVSEDESLKLKGSITNHKWLKTNDLIELIDNKSFKWIGRKDFIINSGGLKINPEHIEEKLRPQIGADFIITSVNDQNLGQKIILLSAGQPQTIDFSGLDKYHAPKAVFFNQTIYRTATNKPDRNQTIKHFNRQQ